MMTLASRVRLFSLLMITPLALAAQSPTPALEVIGDGGAVKTFSMSQLAALPRVDVAAELDGTNLVFRGPTLRSLMTLVGAPAGQALRGSASMLLVVVAEAGDGYKVGYMLSELDPQFGARNAILALTQDGKPLAERDGPLRMVVPGEQHHARWIRQVQRIRLVRVPG